MHRDRLVTVAVAALVVVVAGVVAGSVASTTTVERGGGAGVLAGSPPADPDPIDTGTPPSPGPLGSVVFAVLVAVSVAAVFANPRLFLRRTLQLGGAGAVLLGLLYLALMTTGGGEEGDPREFQRTLLEGARNVVAEPGLSEGPSTTSPTLLLAVGLVVLAGFGLLVVLTDVGRDERGPTEGGEPDGDEETLAAVGRTAGRAAERLEGAGADVDNEVYRAWAAMTDHLEVDNRPARTPGEFRTAALAAGMAAEDVDALTELFETVRYGGRPATADREAEAVAALRRVEARYADAEGSA